MSPSSASLLESALALPEQDRAAIAEALLSSLSGDSAELDDEEFTRELQRRSEEMETDPTSRIPWSELKKQR